MTGISTIPRTSVWNFASGTSIVIGIARRVVAGVTLNVREHSEQAPTDAFNALMR